jgi:hypothetical protein
MQQIALAQVPNQSFSVQLDGDIYDIRLTACTGIMAVDISRNNEVLLTGSRVVAGFPLIPYTFIENGNFIITTMDGDIPYYTQFGVTQFLVYASAAELEAIRASS